MKTVIEMAREAGLFEIIGFDKQRLERFAALVREDEREKQQEPVAWVKAKELAIAKSLSDDGYAKQWSTTLGFKKEDGDIPLYTTPPTIEAAVLAEREACAKVCEGLLVNGPTSMWDTGANLALVKSAAAIRARGEK